LRKAFRRETARQPQIQRNNGFNERLALALPQRSRCLRTIDAEGWDQLTARQRGMAFTIRLKTSGIEARACQLHYRPAPQRVADRGDAPGVYLASNSRIANQVIHYAAQIARPLPELPGILLRFIAGGGARMIGRSDDIPLRRHALRQPVQVAPVAAVTV